MKYGFPAICFVSKFPLLICASAIKDFLNYLMGDVIACWLSNLLGFSRSSAICPGHIFTVVCITLTVVCEIVSANGMWHKGPGINFRGQDIKSRCTGLAVLYLRLPFKRNSTCEVSSGGIYRSIVWFNETCTKLSSIC